MFKKNSLISFGADALFWLVWLIITIAGYAVVWIVFKVVNISCSCDAAAVLLDITNKEPKLFAALMGLMIGLPFGLIIGLFQRLILRNRIDQSNRWVILTGLGGMFGWAAAALIPGSYDPTNFFSLVIYPMAISAIGMAVLQTWALQLALPESLWWVLATLVPWILIEFADLLSSLVGINNLAIPLILFSAGIIAATAVYVFGQSEQRKFNALILGGLCLLIFLIWGVISKLV